MLYHAWQDHHASSDFRSDQSVTEILLLTGSGFVFVVLLPPRLETLQHPHGLDQERAEFGKFEGSQVGHLYIVSSSARLPLDTLPIRGSNLH